MKKMSITLIAFISIVTLNACNNTPTSVMEDTWVEIKDTTHLPDITSLYGHWEEFRGIIVRNNEEYDKIPQRIIDTTRNKNIFTGTLPEAPDFASYSYLAYTFFEQEATSTLPRNMYVKVRRVFRNDNQKKIRYELDMIVNPEIPWTGSSQYKQHQYWIRIPKVPVDYSLEIKTSDFKE